VSRKIQARVITVRTKLRKPGRPRKKEGRIELWQFARAAMVSCAYDADRVRGAKHSVAVRQAVDYVKRYDSKMAISESGVRRILANSRPQESGTILRFEPSIRSDEDLQMNCSISGELAALQGKRGITLPDVPNYDLSIGNLVMTIRVGKRPHYHRHNRKISKD
jgi:hypothetical protein